MLKKLFCILLALCVFLSVPIFAQDKASQSKELVPIKIELPKPMFIGTPQNLGVKKLETPPSISCP